MGQFFNDYGTYIALAATCFITFFNWRTAEAGKKSPIHERLSEAITNNKEFANRIADNNEQLMTQLIPNLMLRRDGGPSNQ
jgi:hypothetical protein